MMQLDINCPDQAKAEAEAEAGVKMVRQREGPILAGMSRSCSTQAHTSQLGRQRKGPVRFRCDAGVGG